MKREVIIQKLEAILKQNNFESKQVDLGRSVVIGVKDKVLFDVIDRGFIVSVSTDRLKELEARPEASMVTNSLVPDDNKLFVTIQENDDELLQFWANEGIKTLT